MKRFPEHQLNAKVRRTRDATALSRLALLLLSRTIGEVLVLRELQVDQPGGDGQHPEANKSRDEERAAL